MFVFNVFNECYRKQEGAGDCHGDLIQGKIKTEL